MRCVVCNKSWKKLLRKSYNLPLIQKLKNKSGKLQVSNLNYKRREKRLRNKVYLKYGS